MLKKIILRVWLGWSLTVLVIGCAQMPTPSEDNFFDPKISLVQVEITYYAGYYYFSSDVNPTRGQAGDYGAPMQLSFIYELANPNAFPVVLDGFSFTVLFEEFEVNTVSSPETMWIPPGKTNQLRVPATFDTRQTLLNLQLPGALKLKEKNLKVWDVLERWWTQAPDFAYQISASQGAAVFKADGITRVVAFRAVYP